MHREEAVPILRVRDHAVAAAWYARIGFELRDVHRFGAGFPAFATITRGDVTLFLSEHEHDARPDTLIYLRVRDVDAVAAELGVGVDDSPWARECEATDPDGNRLRIGTPTWW